MRGYTPVSSSRGEKPVPPSSFIQRRKRPLTIALIASAPILALLAWITHDPSSPFGHGLGYGSGGIDGKGDGWEYVDSVAKEKGLRRLSWGALKGQGAKANIRENLRDDKGYLFSMYGAGWNNQVIQMMNLIYLAHLSDRIPILPSFRWNMPHPSPDVAVSEIFSLSQVSSSLNDLPLVEMHEIKGTTTLPDRLKWVKYDGEVDQYKSTMGRYALGDKIRAEEMGEDEVGCWSMHESKGEVAHQSGMDLYLIHTPFTPLPHSVYDWAVDPGRPAFHPVADLLRPRHLSDPPAQSLEILRNHSMPDPPVWPDAHVACIDTTFGFVEQINRYDVGGEYRSGTGAWAAVGNRMRFSPGIERIGEMYLREILGVRGDVPPFIAVHIRRGDFGDAFLALSQRQYAHAAWTVKESLRIKHGVDVKHVLATSDETDPAWIAVLEDYGFTFVNHTRLNTVERFGEWFPTVLDSYLLSRGKGFLGVIYSTMSILAYRRTIDWNQGVARMIELDHQVDQDWVWT